jgi:hypothetical protein
MRGGYESIARPIQARGRSNCGGLLPAGARERREIGLDRAGCGEE